MKRVLLWLGGGLAVVVAALAIFVGFQVLSFNRDANRVWDIAHMQLAVSTDSSVLARGRHLSESYGGCVGCHGPDFGGQLVEDLGPVGAMIAPNITLGEGSVIRDHSDADLARAIRHGVRRDGTSLLFMPTIEHNWWPDEDIAAVVSYLRTMPPVDRPSERAVVRTMGKMLTRLGMFPTLSALQVDHGTRPQAPAPAPTAAYGVFLARSCVGCHGDNLSGGRIPGAPAELPTPANLTPHETGLADWSQDDFFTAITDGIRPDGRRLDPFMPIEGTGRMTDIEKSAVWAYLQSLEPLEFGNR